MQKISFSKERIISLVAGVVLFILSALFSIGIFSGIFDFGSVPTQNRGVLFRLGQVLVGAYGLSSFLIPIFFFVSGAFCIDSHWSLQRLMCLSVSILPFFTIVISENSCRRIASNDVGIVAVAKIIILLFIAVLLVAAEYLVTLVVSGILEKKYEIISSKPKNQKSENELKSEDEFDDSDFDSEGDDEYLSEIPDVVDEVEDFPDPIVNEEFMNGEEEVAKVDKHSSESEEETESRKEQLGMRISAFLKKNRSRIERLTKFGTAEEREAAEPVDINEYFDESGEIASSTKNSDSEVGKTLLDEVPVTKMHGVSAAETTEMQKASLLNDGTSRVVYLGTSIRASSAKETPPEEAIVPKQEQILNQTEIVDKKEIESAPSEESVNENQLENTQNAEVEFDEVIEQFERSSLDAADVLPANKANSSVQETETSTGEILPKLNDVFAKMDKDVLAEVKENRGISEDNLKLHENLAANEEFATEDFSDAERTILSEADIFDDDEPISEVEANLSHEATILDEASDEDFSVADDFDVVDEDTNFDEAGISESELKLIEAENEQFDEDRSLDSEEEDANLSNEKLFVVPEENAESKKEPFVPAPQLASAFAPDKIDSPMATPAAPAAYAEIVEPKKEPFVVENPDYRPNRKVHGPYEISTELLTAYADDPYWIIDDETKQAAQKLESTLNEFKIKADVTGIRKGPVVTMFEMLPAPGVKLNKIVALQDNIALRLAAASVRIVAPIPGKQAVGIEVPNKKRAIISIRECLEQARPEWKKMGVPVVLGKDIQGETQIIDLVKTPHLLIAGATGAGKSVCVNSMILSILYKRSPNEVKMIMIDPKVVELKLYNDIPHLLTPVITEPKKAMQALQYCLCEMERRYALLDQMGVRDISTFNKKIVEKKMATETLPYLIVIIDEFADLMATTGKQLEGVLARLAAMSRAVGIHLVLATQRPSIDVITGLIKANIPSRIAFMVAGKMDSRIIIDQVGAEKLLGKGDMLYASSTDPFPIRIQGTFVSDQDVENVVDAVKSWGEPEYIDDEIFVDDDEDDSGEMSSFDSGEDDPLFEKAVDIVMQAGKASASYIQRRLKIGYNRAARLVEQMEERGLVGPANGSKPREIIHVP